MSSEVLAAYFAVSRGKASGRIGSRVMWMRLCAACKKVMLKPHLSHSVRCWCGWEW